MELDTRKTMSDKHIDTSAQCIQTVSISITKGNRRRIDQHLIVSLGSLYLSLSVLFSMATGSPVTSPLTSPSVTSHGFLRLQPELDKIDIDSYLKNRKALRIQINCLVFDGPCDWVGRWLKPRAAAALLGECLVCTEHQKSQMQKIMDFIQVNFPDEFKLGIKKYLLQFGIPVPAESTTSASPTLSSSSNSSSDSLGDYPTISSSKVETGSQEQEQPEETVTAATPIEEQQESKERGVEGTEEKVKNKVTAVVTPEETTTPAPSSG